MSSRKRQGSVRSIRKAFTKARVEEMRLTQSGQWAIDDRLELAARQSAAAKLQNARRRQPVAKPPPQREEEEFLDRDDPRNVGFRRKPPPKSGWLF